MALWIYDCDMGQGAVHARTEAEARNKTLADAGALSCPRNLRKASKEDISWRKAMGGRC